MVASSRIVFCSVNSELALIATLSCLDCNNFAWHCVVWWIVARRGEEKKVWRCPRGHKFEISPKSRAIKVWKAGKKRKRSVWGIGDSHFFITSILHSPRIAHSSSLDNNQPTNKLHRKKKKPCLGESKPPPTSSPISPSWRRVSSLPESLDQEERVSTRSSSLTAQRSLSTCHQSSEAWFGSSEVPYLANHCRVFLK